MSPFPVLERDALRSGAARLGPAIVADLVATTWVAPGWIAVTDSVGNLWLNRPPVVATNGATGVEAQ